MLSFKSLTAVLLVLPITAAAPSDTARPVDFLAIYRTAPVVVGDVERKVSVIGELKAVSTVDVGSSLSGQVARLLVDFNDAVAEGQPLAEIDQRGYRTAIAKAEAELQAAEAELPIRRARIEAAQNTAGESHAKLRVLRHEASRAEAQRSGAAAGLAAARRLVKKGVASKASTTDERTAFAVADAEVKAAAARIEAQALQARALDAAAREAEGELAKGVALIAARGADVRIAQLDLDRSVIRSPLAGIVVNRNVEQGQTVAASLDAPTLFQIAADPSRIEIHARIHEADITAIAVGQPATFRVDALPKDAFAATVRQIRRSAEIQQGVVTYTVVLDARNDDGRLLPGMTSVIDVVTSTTGPVPMAPLAALAFEPSADADVSPKDRSAATVWTISADGKLRAVRAEAGPISGDLVALVDADIADGAQVVVGRREVAAASIWRALW